MSGPLVGRRIVLTRAASQAGSLIRRLEELGAQVSSAPAIAIAPPEDAAALTASAALLSQADWLVFTSANGVDAALAAFGGSPWSAGFLGRCACVGPATAARLERATGRAVDLIPAEHHAEGLLAAFEAEELAGRLVLLYQGNRARPTLRQGLEARGAELRSLVAYRTLAADPGPALRRALDQGADAVVFTSGSAAESCAAALEGAGLSAALGRALAVSIGPKTSEALRRLGLERLIEARPHNADGIIEVLRATLGPESAADGPR